MKLEQALTNWCALDLWNPSFFSESFGEREIDVGGKPMTIAEFAHLIDSPLTVAGHNPYARQTKLKTVVPELLEHILPLPPFLQPNWLDASHLPARFSAFSARDFELLFGGPTTYFPVIHYDANHQHALR